MVVALSTTGGSSGGLRFKYPWLVVGVCVLKCFPLASKFSTKQFCQHSHDLTPIGRAVSVLALMGSPFQTQSKIPSGTLSLRCMGLNTGHLGWALIEGRWKVSEP